MAPSILVRMDGWMDGTCLSLTAHQQMTGRASVLAEQTDTTHSRHYHGNSLGSLDWKTVQNHTGVLHTEGENLIIMKKQNMLNFTVTNEFNPNQIKNFFLQKIVTLVPVVYDGQYPD